MKEKKSDIKVGELTEEELENLLERIDKEQEVRYEKSFSELSDGTLDIYSKEVKMELSKRRKRGKVNSDPIFEFD